MALPTQNPASPSGTINTLPNATTADGNAVGVAIALSSTSTATSVTAAAADTALLASNTARRKFSVFNDSTVILYLLENSGTSSLTNYTVQVPAGGFYSTTDWQGAVRGIWASATGAARVMEYTS